MDDSCAVEVVKVEPASVEYVAFHAFSVDTMIVEFTVTTWDTFTVDVAIVLKVRVDPVSVEKNPLLRYIDDTCAVDVTKVEPVSVE